MFGLEFWLPCSENKDTGYSVTNANPPRTEKALSQRAALVTGSGGVYGKLECHSAKWLPFLCDNICAE